MLYRVILREFGDTENKMRFQHYFESPAQLTRH